MHEVSTVLILMCIVTVLAFWTRSWSIPYSTLMVLVGVAIALLAAANLYLDGRKSHGDAVSEIDYLRSHFRAQADSWLMRLDLDDVSFLENQSPFCLSIFGSFNRTAASIERAGTSVHNREVAGSKIRARDRYGRNSHQIDL